MFESTIFFLIVCCDNAENEEDNNIENIAVLIFDAFFLVEKDFFTTFVS